MSVGVNTHCIMAKRALIEIKWLAMTECMTPFTLLPAFTLLLIYAGSRIKQLCVNDCLDLGVPM